MGQRVWNKYDCLGSVKAMPYITNQQAHKIKKNNLKTTNYHESRLMSKSINQLLALSTPFLCLFVVRVCV